MLPKRSTPVDQTLESESIHSQLSLAIFIAPRNLLGSRKSLTARDITKIILVLYDITPPRKVKNSVFPQLQPFIKFF